MNKKQIDVIELQLEGPSRSQELIKKMILREIGDIFYSVRITSKESKLVDDK